MRQFRLCKRPSTIAERRSSRKKRSAYVLDPSGGHTLLRVVSAARSASGYVRDPSESRTLLRVVSPAKSALTGGRNEKTPRRRGQWGFVSLLSLRRFPL